MKRGESWDWSGGSCQKALEGKRHRAVMGGQSGTH